LTWLIFNVLHYPNLAMAGFGHSSLAFHFVHWLHIAASGVVEVDKVLTAAPPFFEQMPMKSARLYGVALVALVALGLFKSTTQKLRFMSFHWLD